MKEDTTGCDKEVADEQQLAEVIRHGGSREQPPDAVRAAVRRAAADEWRAVVAGRARQRTLRWAVAAAAAVAALAVWIVLPLVRPPAAVVASVTRVNGRVDASRGAFASFSPMESGEVVVASTRIRSGTGGRIALQMGSTSLRMDEDSAMTLVAAGRVALNRGAVYVDSGPGAAGSLPLVIETDFATVEHLGTQYETRLTEDGVRVRVREGRVRLKGTEQSVEGRAGEQVTLLGTGEVRRQPVARTGEEWAWVGEIAPAFDIENRPLIQFLRWAGRETGRQISFASSACEKEAAQVVLRGSIEGLTPERALAAVLATTRFDYRVAPGRLVIDFRTGER